jgi:hypothetical protein
MQITIINHTKSHKLHVQHEKCCCKAAITGLDLDGGNEIASRSIELRKVPE